MLPVVICPSLVPGTLQSLCSPRVTRSVGDGCLPLQLGLCYSNLAWLTPTVAPNPNVELLKPSAIASHCSLAVSKAVGRGLSPFPSHEAWREWHPAQDIPSHWQANVQASRLELLAVS